MPLGQITLQPSEIVKFALVLYFADYADRHAADIRKRGENKAFFTTLIPFLLIAAVGASMVVLIKNRIIGIIFAAIILGMDLVFMRIKDMKHTTPAFYYGILPYMVVLVIVGGLMYLQPHMSGLIIMAGITFAMMFMGGTNLFYLVGGACVGALGLFGLAMTKGHSSSRILVWKDPFAYLLNGGWQPAPVVIRYRFGRLLGRRLRKQPSETLIFTGTAERLHLLDLVRGNGLYRALCLSSAFSYSLSTAVSLSDSAHPTGSAHFLSSALSCMSACRWSKHCTCYQFLAEYRYFAALLQLRRHVVNDPSCRNGRGAIGVPFFTVEKS